MNDREKTAVESMARALCDRAEEIREAMAGMSAEFENWKRENGALIRLIGEMEADRCGTGN